MITLEYTSHRNELASRMRRIRIEQGLSTRKFALMVGISKTYLRKLEMGEASPTFDMLERLAAGLDIPLHELVRFDDPNS